ncbi:MAG: ABC-type transport auxiliary lipoprotein family protein [Pseudomonadota bacterium]
MNQSFAKFAPRRALLALAMAAVLAGCASSKGPSTSAIYDFGPAAGPAALAGKRATLPAVVITDVTGNAAYDSERMFYRLNYADPLQARSYANSRWSSTPLQLLTQRFKSRVAQSGVKVLSTTDASTGVPLVRIDLDDFTHSFDSTASSYGEVVVRVSLFDKHTLVDQRTFRHKVAAPSADAPGGARALAQAADAVATEMITWLASEPRTAQTTRKQ